MDFEIPNGLTDLLRDFTVQVLRQKPDNLVDFAAEYFANLKEADRFKYSAGRNKGSEPMQTSSDDDEPIEPPPPPKNRFARRKSVSAERYDPEADDDSDVEKVVHPKTDAQRKRLETAVKSILLFRSLDQDQIREVLDAMFERKVTQGEHVIDQGDDGDNFYVIDSGTYDIYINTEDNGGAGTAAVTNSLTGDGGLDGAVKKVGAYQEEGSFGELALMYNMPRAATILASSATGTLWAVDRQTFRRILMKSAFKKRKMYEELISNVPMLATLEAYERMNVADALSPKVYEGGEVIIKQGDSAEGMFFVEDGEVSVTIQAEDGKEMEVTRLSRGSYFGELALVTSKPRAATVTAVPKTKCAYLDVSAFERLLGPCMDIMKRNIGQYEDQLTKLFGAKVDLNKEQLRQ